MVFLCYIKCFLNYQYSIKPHVDTYVSAFVSLPGVELGCSIPPLQTEAALGHFDAVLHIGDIAYDMSYDNAR